MYFIEDSAQLSGSFLIILAILSTGVMGQFPRCEEATSCCQCVTRPMCSWIDTPLDSSQPKCISLHSSSLRESLPSHGLLNDLIITQDRPFNRHRKRYLRPQRAKLTMALGISRDINIRVVARTRRFRLTVQGPVDAPGFKIVKGDAMSCARRFRSRVTTRQGSGAPSRDSRRNGRPTQPHKRISIDCMASAVGAVQPLKLIVTMNKCYESTKEIRVNIRERGSRKFKLDVASSCECPCLSTGIDESQDACSEGEASRQCTSNEEDTVENQCPGTNDRCHSDEHGPICSGHGTCVCGGCVCHHVASRSAGNGVHEESVIVFGDATQTTPNHYHYTGEYCQCDDTSCPKHDDQVCGGPDQGTCQCGQCVCREGFLGDACEQAVSEETCMGPNRLVCSGQGDCVYGRCVCRGTYTGHYCQNCMTCPTMCSRLSPCVKCIVSSQSETPESNCVSECTLYEQNPQISFVPVVDEWPDMAHFCETNIEDYCILNFAYETQEDWNIAVHYSTNIQCPTN